MAGSLFYQRIECLPREFRNIIIHSTRLETIIRSDVGNMQDIGLWVQSFSENSFTQWIVRDSKPESSAKMNVCMKKYVCHHSNYGKVAIDMHNKNKRGISKSTACKAQMKLKIKLTTVKTKRTDPYVKDGLPGVITIHLVHNHPLQNPVALRYLSPKTDVRDNFRLYFEMNMTITQACQYHAHQLPNGNDEIEKENMLDNSMFNPTYRTVKHWFEVWRKETYDNKREKDVERILHERMNNYKKDNGVIIEYQREPFCLLVITPLMQRVHDLPCSKDQLFIDSTTSCASDNYSITFLLSSTVSGALPNAVLITKQQTAAAYTSGFKLLRESLSSSFYNQNYAEIVMTDNCSAKVTAIKKVWPESENLLCISYVLQYVLYWLEDKSHNIPKHEQQNFISAFQTILYCTDVEDAENAFCTAIEISEEFPEWQKYLQDQWKNREKWCLAFRLNLINDHINYFAEITIQLFKENILSRIKAYNIVALLDFIVLTVDTFYSKKLRNFFNSKTLKNHLYLDWILKKTKYLKKDNIVQINNETYTVPSEDSRDIIYTIDMKTGWCNCIAGMRGIYCKHLGALYKFFGLKGNNFPAVTKDDQRNMAYVALGKGELDALDDNYILPLHTNKTDDATLFMNGKNNNGSKEDLNHTEDSEFDDHIIEMIVEDEQENSYVNGTNNNEHEEDLSHTSTPPIFEDCEFDNHIIEILAEDEEEPENSLNIEMNADNTTLAFKDFLNVWCSIYSNYTPSYKALMRATASLSTVCSHDQVESVLHTLGNSITLRQRNLAKMKVQTEPLKRRGRKRTFKNI